MNRWINRGYKIILFWGHFRTDCKSCIFCLQLRMQLIRFPSHCQLDWWFIFSRIYFRTDVTSLGWRHQSAVFNLDKSPQLKRNSSKCSMTNPGLKVSWIKILEDFMTQNIWVRISESEIMIHNLWISEWLILSAIIRVQSSWVVHVLLLPRQPEMKHLII